MEGQIKFKLLPSLQRRALIKTVTTLCNQDDIRYSYTSFDFELMRFGERQEDWQVVVEDQVIKKVRVLPLPESLKIRLVDFVKPVCLEVQQWWNYHVLRFSEKFVKENLRMICWTPQGTVDKKKTAEAIIRDDYLDIKGSYKLACIYCLKDYILMLWNKMPEYDREYFYSERDPGDVRQHRLVILWTYDLKGEMTRLESFTRRLHRCTPYQYAMEQVLIDGNQVATEYLLQKICTEGEDWLVRSARMYCSHIAYSRSDVLYFLLTQMNEEQQIEVLKYEPFRVLACLMDWPWQDYFMQMAKHMWAFLPRDVFYVLLRRIVRKIKCGFKDYDYQYLFREFWQQSPKAHKQHVTDLCTRMGDFSLKHLLQIKDKGNIELILKDLTTPDREKVIFFTCKRILLDEKEMDSLEFFVQECLTTKDITFKFREELKRLIFLYRTPEKGKEMWSKVCQLLDDLTQNCDYKRCVEDGNTCPAKRLCS